MELRHLRYFVAVAEALNFSHAAERLHVSQPPLSRQIRDLEEELGVQLFERRKNKLKLTAAGEFFYDGAKRLLEQSEDLVHATRRAGVGHRPQLRIGYIANIHGRLVIEAATRFRKVHPDVEVKVFDCTTADQVRAMVAGEMEVGFVGFPEAPVEQGLNVERIGSTYAILALARSHRLARRKGPALALFKDDPFVTIKEEAFPGARRFVIDFCQKAGFQPRIAREARHPIDVLHAVAIGEGVALVPEQMRYAPHPGVVFCELPEPVPHIDSYIAWKAETGRDQILDFIGIAKAVYGKLRQRA